MAEEHVAQKELDWVEHRFPDEQWAGWTPGRGVSRVAREIAEQVADGTVARAHVESAIERINADSLRKGGMVGQNAVWVPDRATGEVVAIMDFTKVDTPGGVHAPEQYLARNLRKDFGWTTRVVEYTADVGEVQAGRLTVEQVLLRGWRDRTVQSYLFVNVYPPGSRNAASFVFNTVHLDLVPEVARQAWMIAESLVLTLCDPVTPS